jgi:sugar lactone lactonase YvrE
MPVLLVGAWLLLAPLANGGPEPAQSAPKALPAGAVGKLEGRVAGTMAFSPDGKLLATGGVSSIELWNTAKRNKVGELVGHDGMVYAVAFSPDNKLLASASSDGTVRLWDVAAAKELAKLEGHKQEVRSVCFSPDGSTLASGGADYKVRLWDVPSRKEMRVFDEERWVYAVAFSPDGKQLAVAGIDKLVRLREVATGKELRTLAGDSHFTYSVAFSPDGKFIAAAGHDGKICLGDVASGEALFTLREHANPVYAVAFSPDGKTLASIDNDGKICLWEVISGELRRSLPATSPLLRACIAFSPDGKTLAAPGRSVSVLLWDRTGRGLSGSLPAVNLSAEQHEAYWLDLASTDSAKGAEAVWLLVSAPKEALHVLNRRLQPVTVDPRKIAQWIGELDSDKFAVRQQATDELAQLGSMAEPALRQILQEKPSLEVRQRVEQLLAKLEGAKLSPEQWRHVRSVEILENIGTSEARELLQKLARGAEGARLTQEAKAAVERLAKRPEHQP